MVLTLQRCSNNIDIAHYSFWFCANLFEVRMETLIPAEMVVRLNVHVCSESPMGSIYSCLKYKFGTLRRKKEKKRKITFRASLICEDERCFASNIGHNILALGSKSGVEGNNSHLIIVHFMHLLILPSNPLKQSGFLPGCIFGRTFKCLSWLAAVSIKSTNSASCSGSVNLTLVIYDTSILSMRRTCAPHSFLMWRTYGEERRNSSPETQWRVEALGRNNNRGNPI